MDQSVSVTTTLAFVWQKQSHFVPSGDGYLWVLSGITKRPFSFCQNAVLPWRNYIQISFKERTGVTQYFSFHLSWCYTSRWSLHSNKPLLVTPGRKHHKLQLEVSPVVEGQPCPYSWASDYRTCYIKSPYLLRRNSKYRLSSYRIWLGNSSQIQSQDRGH